jgi:hypothetical protein
VRARVKAAIGLAFDSASNGAGEGALAGPPAITLTGMELVRASIGTCNEQGGGQDLGWPYHDGGGGRTLTGAARRGWKVCLTITDGWRGSSVS